MKVDDAGISTTTGPGGVWIVSPAGTHLGTILLPETGTNMKFGDDDGKTLYITDREAWQESELKVQERCGKRRDR